MADDEVLTNECDEPVGEVADATEEAVPAAPPEAEEPHGDCTSDTVDTAPTE